MTTTSYSVEGLTCGHCASAVTSEVAAIDGVTEVSVDLVPSAVSRLTVTSASPVADELLVEALAEAGDYRLVRADAGS